VIHILHQKLENVVRAEDPGQTPFVVDHDEVANSRPFHPSERFLDGGGLVERDDRVGHDLLHGRLTGHALRGHDPEGEVSVGDDPHGILAVRDHDGGAHVMFGHAARDRPYVFVGTGGRDHSAAKGTDRHDHLLFQFFHVFNCRSLDRSIIQVDPFSNRFLFVSLLAAFLAQLAALYWTPFQTIFRTVPLGVGQWLVIVAIGSTVIAGGELDKWWNRRKLRPLG